MTKKPLVSIIIPTRNSGQFLEKCLISIKNQTYKNIELIVVDNNSTDKTKEIAKKYTRKVYNRGPERSAQRNYGAKKAQGDYIYFVDSDFTLDKDVVKECVQKIPMFDAIVVHNTPDETVGWIAKIRKFEVDMYKYDLAHSAARFFKKEVFQEIKGYNEKITAGEDSDIQNKLNRYNFKTGFVNAEALHLGEPKSFWRHMKKYYEYGKDFQKYAQDNKEESTKQPVYFWVIYLKNWKKFLKYPLLGLGFIFYTVSKFGFGGMGFIMTKVKSYESIN